MTRFRIVAVTAAAMIALAAWWVPLQMGGAEDECLGGGTCAAEPSAPRGSGSPDWFYGGDGMDRIRGGDRRDVREGQVGENEIRCGPGRDEVPMGSDEELSHSCEDVRARFY